MLFSVHLRAPLLPETSLAAARAVALSEPVGADEDTRQRVAISDSFPITTAVKQSQTTGWVRGVIGAGVLLLGCAPAIAGTTTPSPSTTTPVSHPAKNTLQKPLPYQCPGAPRQQVLTTPSPTTTTNIPLKLDKVRLTAEKLNRDEKTGLYTLSGKVEIRQGNSVLEANNAVIDRKAGSVVAQGGLSFHSPEIDVRSSKVRANLKTQSLEADGAHYQLSETALRGGAKKLKLDANGRLTLENGSFTSCPPGHESWTVEAGSITIDPKLGWGSATNMVLRIHHIPVLYLPLVRFPASKKRLSGFLAPTFGSSRQNGREISLPFYWNIAPNYDATLTPRFLSDRGTQLKSEWRYLSQYQQASLETGYLGSDNKATGATPRSRYRYRIQQQSYFGDHWRTAVDYSDISDDNYFFDLGGDLASSNIIELNRRAAIRYQGEQWQVQALFSTDHTLNSALDPYKRLPQINWQYQLPVARNTMVFDFDGEFTRFDRNNSVTADRLTLEPSLTLPLEWLSGFLTPKLRLNYRHYQQDNPFTGNRLNRSISTPILSLDGGIYLERDFEFGATKYLQTLEPRLFYLYVPARDQQGLGLYDTALATPNYQWLFRENRFSGGDRLADANQLSLGISSRLLDPKSGEELLRVGIGQVFYLANRRVALTSDVSSVPVSTDSLDNNSSPIVADIELNWSERWHFNATMEWQPSDATTTAASFNVQYLPGDKQVFNLGHRRRILSDGSTLEQADMSFAYRLNDDWRTVGRWYRDLAGKRNIETLFGVEYDSCCWAVRLVQRRYLNVALDAAGNPISLADGQYNNGVFLEFVLKGLSSLGNTGFLSNSVIGYQDPFVRR